MKLSIIVPVYNEEKTIIDILKLINKMNYKIPFEIVVVNDGSTDKTFELLLKSKHQLKNIRIISYRKSRGKGYALREGIKNSKGDIIIFQDADLEYNPRQIPALIKPIINGECDVVYGSRFLGELKGMKPLYIFGNKILTFLTNLLFNSNLTDMETCYKAMRKAVLKRILLRGNGFEIEPEITAKILKRGYLIKEFPIAYVARKSGEGKKVRWKDGIKSLKFIFKIKFNF
jgi:glycosyltransferase involved in cell wall biosynthesis